MEIHCYIHILVYNPLHHSPSSPLPLPRTISTGFILLFSHMNTKYIYHIHSHSLFLYAYPLRLVPPEKTYFSLLPFIFLKCILIVQGGIHLGTSGLFRLCFTQINPPLLTTSLSPCSPNIQQLTVHYVIFIYNSLVS
jgi:hypothetical protein